MSCARGFIPFGKKKYIHIHPVKELRAERGWNSTTTTKKKLKKNINGFENYYGNENVINKILR